MMANNNCYYIDDNGCGDHDNDDNNHVEDRHIDHDDHYEWI